MAVGSIKGTNRFISKLSSLENSGKSDKAPKSKSNDAPKPPKHPKTKVTVQDLKDDLVLSANQKPKSNSSHNGHKNHISYTDNSTTYNDNSTTYNDNSTTYNDNSTTYNDNSSTYTDNSSTFNDNSNTYIDNSTTINNYYNNTTPSDGSNAGKNNTINYYSQEQDLSAFNERLDALTKELDDLGNAVAKFEKLVLDFEGRIGNFEQGEGPVIRGQLQIEGLSFSNINFALKFAKQGFDLVDILQTAGGSEKTGGLDSISSSLTRSLESLKSQSQNLDGLFSNNLGTALNQAV